MSAQPTPIYLDHNATTPIDPRVREAMLPFLGDQYGNPSSLHSLGMSAARAVEHARQQLAELLVCRTDELIFTSGGTESSNLAILGTLLTPDRSASAHVISSAIEHPATHEPLQAAKNLGCTVSIVGCDSTGIINPKTIEAAIRPQTKLVSIMHANNEIGTIQPIHDIAHICRKAGILFHVDAAQTVGKIPVSCRELGVDLLTVAGHKFYAPKGIGCLFIRHGVDLTRLLHGGGQEGGLSPGTENVPHIVALGQAAEIARQRCGQDSTQMGALRDQLESLLKEKTDDTIVIHAHDAPRLSNTTSIAFPDIQATSILDQIPFLCASTGAACHSHATTISATLRAIGLTESVAQGTIRMSLGRHTTEDEIDRTATALALAWETTRKLRSAGPPS